VIVSCSFTMYSERTASTLYRNACLRDRDSTALLVSCKLSTPGQCRSVLRACTMPGCIMLLH
jgi:hypothetical protein